MSLMATHGARVRAGAKVQHRGTIQFRVLVTWTTLVPWLAFLYSVQGNATLRMVTRAILPAAAMLISLPLIFAPRAAGRSGFVRVLATVGALVLIGLANGSVLDNPQGYARFAIWLPFPGVAVLLAQLRTGDGNALRAPLEIRPVVLALGLLTLSLYAFIANAGVIISGAEEWVAVSNFDKGEYVRIPVGAGRAVMLLGVAMIVCRRHRRVGVVALVFGALILVKSNARQATFLSLTMAAVALLLRRDIFNGQLARVTKIQLGILVLLMATVLISDRVEGLQDTSWQTRLESLRFALARFEDSQPSQWLCGFGMYVDRTKTVLPETFWPSDLWVLGVAFEFGLMGFAAYIALVGHLLSRVLRLARVSPPKSEVQFFLVLIALDSSLWCITGAAYNNPIKLLATMGLICLLEQVQERRARPRPSMAAQAD